MKKAVLLLTALILILSLSSCSMLLEQMESQTQTLTVDNLSMTVSGVFTQDAEPHRAYDVEYLFRNLGIGIKKTTFEAMEAKGYTSELTLIEYASVLIKELNCPAVPYMEGDLIYFTHTDATDGEECTFFTAVYRTEDAYWFVRFYCPIDEYEEMRPTFVAWAETVSFS